MSNFKYLYTDLNEIFANNPLEYFSYPTDAIVTNYTSNSIRTKYNSSNGSRTQQRDISYKYSNNTNFSSGFQAFYKDYFVGSYTITIPKFCTEIRCFLVGAGGSGGSGGGDTKDQKGTDGAGGGGGGYQYEAVSVTPDSTAELVVGKGGASVSGSGGSNNGAHGNSGADTTITYNGIIYKGNHGVGGDGGHPSSQATASAGAVGNIKSALSSSGMNGGLSGYSEFIKANNFQTYFRPYSTITTYGNGGNGTVGAHDPNSSPTGVGNDGYARIYFMA